MLTSILSLSVVVSLVHAVLAQSVPQVNLKTPHVIVIGFVGGFIKHDNLDHSEGQLVARLGEAAPTGVDVDTFEGHHGEKARGRILSLLDTNHDGILTPDEKQNGRSIIYGHSWGGSEAIALARKLEEEGIAVLVTIQVDSISKVHQNDAVVRAKVARAANFANRMAFSRASPRFALPSPNEPVSSETFDSSTKRVRINAPSIHGTTAFWESLTPGLSVIPAGGNKLESGIRSNLPARGNGGVAR
jgi:hypothetical protein